MCIRDRFKNGSLIYSDEFNGALDRDHWLPRTKTWKVKEGMLIGSPDYKDAVEAQKALGRDHHLGLSPVIRLDDLPSKFVCTYALNLKVRISRQGDQNLISGITLIPSVLMLRGIRSSYTTDKCLLARRLE